MASNVEVDGNGLVKQAAGIVTSLSGNTAALHNACGKDLKFYCYNSSDVIFLISNTKPFIANNSWGEIAAAGKHFKVHPDDETDHEFLAKPGKAYVYRGPGKVEEVK
ncbi:MAG: hypothetical protein GY952_04400 [Rhodobacteraceae bacterium]|nr:hypothetical protein [Paracoccaceae bacterium]